ncbi:gas vesicle protein [Streptacidiphilus sp. ASG 303]|uniref:gas vesicle protein GvpO n=1 Tax=Streptacidiphilus sp. ASG 303 TaxID=2896847 RepID=UPI001E4A590D|nr:gas vesicle protein [Streptacidiphilus sp. ASG 303]MCD0485928.1 gas vesicle protein [Streptacidiphilus sp. ASG 303]
MAEQSRPRPRPAAKSTEKTADRAAGRTAARPARRPGVGPAEAARNACDALEELIRHRVEGVSGVERTEYGWCVSVDMLELPRIPDTTSLLATYEVQLDRDGELVGYRRVHRYRRGAADS